MWAMLASPLIAGNDLRSMSKETAAILTNKSVIALNQDPLGVQAFKYAARDGVEYWFKPLDGGDWALVVLNRNKDARKITFDWKTEHVNDDLSKRDAAFATRATSCATCGTVRLPAIPRRRCVERCPDTTCWCCGCSPQQ